MNFKKKLNENGYFKIKLFSKDKCNILKNEMDKLHTYLIDKNPLKNGRLRLENELKIKKIQCNLDISPIIANLSQNNKILDIMKQILGNDIFLWEDKLHYKHAFCGSKYVWHCDYNNWMDKRSENFITIMIHLNKATKENGCLSIIPKSHLEYNKYLTNKDMKENCNFTPGIFKNNVKDPRATHISFIDKHLIKYIECDIGECIIFNSKIQHSSLPNNSNKARKTIFFTYGPKNVGNLYLYNIFRRNFNAFIPKLGCLDKNILWDKLEMNDIYNKSLETLNSSKTLNEISTNRNNKKTLTYYNELNSYIKNEFKDDHLTKIRNFCKYVPRQKFNKVLTHYEIYKKIINNHGCILEFGVMNGGSLFEWAHFSEMLEPTNFLRKIYGFDTFNGFTNITEKDKNSISINSKTYNHQIKEGSFKSDNNIINSINTGIKLFNKNRFLGHINKIQLIKGDICKTLPEFLNTNPHLLISLVHMDVDLYKPTKIAIKNIISRMSKGSIIIFDELNHPDYPGETQALLEILNINNYTLYRMPYSASCSYIII